jgi:putative transposase
VNSIAEPRGNGEDYPGISDATFYWRKKYAGLMPSEMKRLRQLEEENAKLKRIVADLSLDKAMLQDVLSKKL